MSKEHTCNFRFCPYENKIVPEGTGVLSGKRWFHEDCLKTRDNMEAVKRIYYEHISQTVVMSQLVKTIQNIVINKGVDSEYLLFAVKFVVTKRQTIRSPYGLHYIIDDPTVKAAWERKKMQDEQRKQRRLEKEAVQFTAKQSEKEGFERILGR